MAGLLTGTARTTLIGPMCNLYYADLWIMPTIGSERALTGGDRCFGVGIITVPPEREKLIIRSKTTGSRTAGAVAASARSFAAFTLLDVNNHPGTVDGGGLQANGFRNAQACRVARGQDHPMFAAIHAVEEMHNFLRAQDER